MGEGRLYLDVPFDQKDEAKTAGARWDPAAKSWYARGRAWPRWRRLE